MEEKEFEIKMKEEKEDFEQKFSKIFEKLKNFDTTKDQMTDEEFSYISECNSFIFQIDEEIIKAHRSLEAIYSKNSPYLEKQINNPLEYAKIVLKLENTKDIKNEYSTDISFQTKFLILNTNSDKSLNDDELKKSIDFAINILSLDEKKKMILSYISSRMNYIAPNLSILVGTIITIQLIGSVGGLSELAKLNGNMIQNLGEKKKFIKEISTKSEIQHFGFIEECEIIKNVSIEIRKKVMRLFAMKVALASRFDSSCLYTSGEGGQK